MITFPIIIKTSNDVICFQLQSLLTTLRLETFSFLSVKGNFPEMKYLTRDQITGTINVDLNLAIEL